MSGNMGPGWRRTRAVDRPLRRRPAKREAHVATYAVSGATG
jgi:hypothetical protein